MFLDKVNQTLVLRKSFFVDRINLGTIGLALAVNIIHWGLLIRKIGLGNNEILLHYNVIYGADFVQTARYIYLIPGIALGIFFLNLILSAVFYRREKLAAYLLNFSGVVVQIIFLTASAILVIINQ